MQVSCLANLKARHNFIFSIACQRSTAQRVIDAIKPYEGVPADVKLIFDEQRTSYLFQAF
jgi:hypothetical protein